MELVQVKTKADIKRFYKIEDAVYKENPYHRKTEHDIVRLLVEGPTHFHSHACVIPYIIEQNGITKGRFALIMDRKLPGYVQVSFFEAVSGLDRICERIMDTARSLFPDCKKILFGINGHINYGAGYLYDTFNTPPLFGLPYTQGYYNDYFYSLLPHFMVSIRFPTEPFYAYKLKMKDIHLDGLTVRTLDKKRLSQDIQLYTQLNNACFKDHQFWADRTPEEDYELFYPFRFLIKNENILFLQKDSKTIGFFLWYPDFNQLVTAHQQIGIVQVLKYLLVNPIDTFRFTQIAVLPDYQVSKAVLAFILALTSYVQNTGFTYGEGGFIFESNIQSMNMAYRFIKRATGEDAKIYRRYVVYEGVLS